MFFSLVGFPQIGQGKESGRRLQVHGAGSLQTFDGPDNHFFNPEPVNGTMDVLVFHQDIHDD